MQTQTLAKNEKILKDNERRDCAWWLTRWQDEGKEEGKQHLPTPTSHNAPKGHLGKTTGRPWTHQSCTNLMSLHWTSARWPLQQERSFVHVWKNSMYCHSLWVYVCVVLNSLLLFSPSSFSSTLGFMLWKIQWGQMQNCHTAVYSLK